jgi:FkbM family methyltransferase
LRSIIIFLYNLKGGLFKRIIPSILRKNLFYSKIKIIDLKFFKIRLNLRNSIDREIYLKGFYEKKQLDYFYKISKNENIDTFLDIGSYIGYYALFFKYIKNVHAFEPNQDNFETLQFNKKINNAKIKTHNIACSDKSVKSKIWYTDPNKMGGSSIYNKNDFELSKYKKNDLKFENVTLKKLDDIIKIKNQNLLIKIDVERHEINVLKGGCKILTNNKVILQVEVHKDLEAKVFNFLKNNKFNFINSIGPDHYFKNYL